MCKSGAGETRFKMQGSTFTIMALGLLAVVSVTLSAAIDKGTTKDDRTTRLLLRIFQSRNKHFHDDNTANDIYDNKLNNKTIIHSSEKINSSLVNTPDNLISVQKKSQDNTPWKCNTGDHWLELNNHYPRFVKEVYCTSTTCMDDFYACQPRLYTIEILTGRQNDEDIDYGLPRGIRESWKFVEMEVSVGCYCGN